MRSLLVLCLSVAAAHAGVHYTASGIFSPTVPVSFFTAPSQSWSIAFETDENPVPLASTATNFTAPFTGFSYRLNGTGLALTPVAIAFYDLSEGGGFVVRMTAKDEFSFTAPQMFTGTTAAPTMLYGTFVSVTHQYDYLLVDDNEVQSLAGTTLYATPEPGTIALAAGGVLAILAAQRRSADRH